MGFKSSMVTVSNPSVAISERDLLDKLGCTDFEWVEDTTLEECMYPGDKSINIGYYNNCIIICDDYQFSEELEAAATIETAAGYEHTLSTLFPGSEILTTSCHSGVNFHLYSMVKDGKRIRFKQISSESSLREYGRHLQEEDEVYKLSKVVDGKRLFTSTYKEEEEYEYEEDQMMEAFTFGVAKRHLGVSLDNEESDALTFNTPFKKYKKVTRATTTPRKQAVATSATSPTAPATAPSSWLTRLRRKLGI
jgi:hypothetical protein